MVHADKVAAPKEEGGVSSLMALCSAMHSPYKYYSRWRHLNKTYDRWINPDNMYPDEDEKQQKLQKMFEKKMAKYTKRHSRALLESYN